MEKAQLFKRLFNMSMDEICLFIDHDEAIEKSLYKLDMATRTRHIIQAIQFEDMWQSLDAQSSAYDLYLSMRLSPMTLSSCFHLNHEMNCLQWRFVFPKYENIQQDLKPKCFGEYLAMNKNVQVVNIDSYDIARACEFLDKAYDFSVHMNKPIVKPASPRPGSGFSQ